MYHTIGQRHGLRIGGHKRHAGTPWYVARKDVARNTLVVVQGHDHPLLTSTLIQVGPISWLAPEPAPELTCAVQVRHRQTAVPVAACAGRWRAARLSSRSRCAVSRPASTRRSTRTRSAWAAA